MASDKYSNRNHQSGARAAGSDAHGDGSERPDWADGLKQLYDSVVEEPLPDSFRDLLDQLDDGDPPSTGRTP